MATIADIEAALSAYKEKAEARDAKKAVRNEKFAALQTAETDFESAQTDYAASVQEAVEAELELQRVNDEHTAEGVEPPGGAEPEPEPEPTE